MVWLTGQSVNFHSSDIELFPFISIEGSQYEQAGGAERKASKFKVLT